MREEGVSVTCFLQPWELGLESVPGSRLAHVITTAFWGRHGALRYLWGPESPLNTGGLAHTGLGQELSTLTQLTQLGPAWG